MTKQVPVFSQKYELRSPSKEGAYIIPESDWNRLRKIIGRIKSPEMIFLSLGFFFLGVAPTAFFAALTTPLNTEGPKLIIFWAVFSASLLGGIICLLVHFKFRKDLTCSKDDAEDCVKDIENKYPKLN